MSASAPTPISHVNAWPVGDELLVTWRGGGDVSVFVSDDPVDAGTDVRSPDGPGRVTVERAGRPYVHLFDPVDGFRVVAERLVPMDGVRNFRDLGGYPTADGGETRWGQVFRSGRLDETTDADLDRIRRLGIEVVFDLRTQVEVDQNPNRLPGEVEHVHMPMSSHVAVQKGLLDRIVDGDIGSYTQVDMAEGYLRMIDRFTGYLSSMVEAVAAGRKVLFHCTAGKDRTGITAMTLLANAGVADAHVLDDYEISAQHQPEGRVEHFRAELRKAGRDPSLYDLEAMLGSPRPVMRMTLDGVRDRFTDLDGYFSHLGVDGATRMAARANLRYPTV